jgi:hypothetical protein
MGYSCAHYTSARHIALFPSLIFKTNQAYRVLM